MVKQLTETKIIIICPDCGQTHNGVLDKPFPCVWKCYKCNFPMLMEIELKDYPNVVFRNE